MTRFSIVAVILAVALSAGQVVAQEAKTTSDDTVAVQVLSPPTTTVATPETENHTDLVCEAPVKKCGFDSDCPYGKCKSGKCGSCGFDSDCKGWGKCKSGQCGGCGFDSECKGHGKCSSGKCTKSPYK